MFCKYCGAQTNGAATCPNCGAPTGEGQQTYAPYPPQRPNANQIRADKKNTWLIIALVVSVVTGNIAAAVLSGIGLIFFDRANDCFRRGDVPGSDYNFKLSHNLGVASWLLFALGIVFAVIAIIVCIAVFGFTFSTIRYTIPFDAAVGLLA